MVAVSPSMHWHVNCRQIPPVTCHKPSNGRTCTATGCVFGLPAEGGFGWIAVDDWGLPHFMLCPNQAEGVL